MLDSCLVIFLLGTWLTNYLLTRIVPHSRVCMPLCKQVKSVVSPFGFRPAMVEAVTNTVIRS